MCVRLAQSVDQSSHGMSFNIRLQAPYDSVNLRILVTLGPTYPAEAPPQLQLLSRYLGDFGVDSDIFGSVLRVFIARPGVEWNAGDVAIL